MTNPYAPPRAMVRDVAVVGEDTEPADRGTRLVASILDGLIVLAMVWAPLLLGTLISGNASDGAPVLALVGFGLMLVGFVAWAWMTIRYVSANGQSIAKKIMGIKVVRTDGTPATIGRIFWLRNVVNSLIGVIPMYALIDMLFIFGESRQCLHDKLADTIVVKA